MKTILGFFLFAMLWTISGLQADVSIGYVGISGHYVAEVTPVVPVTPAVTPEVKEKPPLPPGGIIVVMRAYLPKIPDLSKEMVQPTDPKEQPRQMKPSEWLKKQTLATIQWVPADKPTFIYFPKEWSSPLNNKSKLTAGLKLSAPVSMEYKAASTKSADSKDAENKVTKLEGALLYQVEGAFDDEAAMLLAYPRPASLAGQPAKNLDIMIVDAKTGVYSADEKNEMGEFKTNVGPFEEGWSDQRQSQSLKFITDVLETMGCFVATAVYHTPDAPQLTVLRAFRDKILLTSPEGSKLVAYYYQHGPAWAREVSHHPAVQAVLKPIFSGVAYVLESINLDSPTTQKIFHVVVSSVEWMATPLITDETQTAPTLPVALP